MQALEISINSSSAASGMALQQLLANFERQHHLPVTVQALTWSTAWTEFIKISLYRHGPVISETGDTWMGSLTARNCLRTFTHKEVAEIGGARNYPRAMWLSCLDFDNESVVAIPWTLETDIIYYRRDLLEAAGLDENEAFTTFEAFTATLEKLRSHGLAYPYAAYTQADTFDTIHHISSWIWGLGGSFLNPEGTGATFSHPLTRSAMRMYFDLHRFIDPALHTQNSETCWATFLEGRAAVTIRESTLLHNLKHGDLSQAYSGQIGTAIIPGVPLMGGANLVIWNHVAPKQEAAAVELVKFLTSSEAQLAYFEQTGLFPARLDALKKIEAPIYASAVKSLIKGQPFPRLRLWGLVEDKLVVALNQVWADLFADPSADVDKIIASRLDPLEARLNITLSQNN